MNIQQSPALVFLADDNHSSLELLRGILSTFGYQNIQKFPNGQLALNAYQKEKADILFLDINMPVLSGLDTLKEIRAINPDAFVVIVSGESSAGNIKDSLSLGAQGFVVKPYSASRIKDVLEKFKKSRPPEGTAAKPA